MSSTTYPRYPIPSVVTGYPISASASASGTAYYPNPNPNPPNPNGYYRNPNSNSNRNNQNPNPNQKHSCKCFDIFFSVLFSVVLSISIVGPVWACYHPDFPEFSVSRFHVSNFNLSPNSLSSDFVVPIAFRNPNKRWSIHYDEIHAAVLYSTDDVGNAILYTNDFVIAKTPMFSFFQRPKNITDREARLRTAGFYVNDEGWIRSGDGEVRFGVRVSSTVWFKLGVWKSSTYYLKVYCDNIRVGLNNSSVAGVGSMVGPVRGCRVFP